jgi:N-acetylglutamate synthase-like GNAT family acetyltransferase
MSTVSLRAATLHDVPEITDLLVQLGYPTSFEDAHSQFAQIMSRDNYKTWVAVHNTTIVGIAGCCTTYYYEKPAPVVTLLVLIVHEQWRGYHIGSKLVAQIEDWGMNQGAYSVVLTSGHWRKEQAHYFYEALGYQSTGTRFVKDLANKDRVQGV